MERKKIMALFAAGLMAVSAAGLPSCAEAAVGGMRAPRMTAPRMNTPRPQAPRTNTPSAPQNARPNQQYRPSQKAGDIPSAAPRAAAPAGQAGANSVPYSGTRWGNMLRNVGWLAGGMMLGSLLGRLFGFGAGSFMGDLFGLLVNGLLIFLAVRLAVKLWGYFRGGSAAQNAAGRQEARAEEPVAPFPVRDIRPPQEGRAAAPGHPGTDYEPARTADWYRSR